MKPFVPFNEFERAGTTSKPLAETMAENCNDRLAPEQAPLCSATPCAPYWVATDQIRCLDNGLVDIQEVDGCGNTRWVRTADKVVWTNTTLNTCADAQSTTEKIFQNQTNQCGETRQVDTGKKCCTVEWIDTNPAVINCDTSFVKKQQLSGCGDTRFLATTNLVLWTNTGQTRCQPGDNYEAEQVNQCGSVRWVRVSACPCVPNWVTNGTIRCVAANVENQEIDGCGATRWVDSGTALLWTATGGERCNINGLMQVEEVNQCGTLRWTTTATACTPPPPPPVDPIPPPNTVNLTGLGQNVGGCFVTDSPGTIEYFVAFGSDGQLSEGSSMGSATIGNAGYWCDPTQVNLYEIKVDSADGSVPGTYYPLPRTLIWSVTKDAGQSGGKNIIGSMQIRRISDGVPMASGNLGGVFLGVGVLCP